MDTSQPLSIESFSYSLSVNLNLDESRRASFDSCGEASFIEMDPKLPPSKRFFISSHDFNFDFPSSQSPLTIVHADELISNGFLVPLFFKPSKMESSDPSNSSPTTPSSSRSQRSSHLANKIRCSSLRRCRRLSRRMFLKYLGFLSSLCEKLRGRGSGSRAKAADARTKEVSKWICSPGTSPRTSVAYSVDNWRGSCDSESSIYEAVLHCKRSIGMPNFSRGFPYQNVLPVVISPCLR
ncbi:hypothetical protein U1Q18_031664 [Sarracenia purpurea var. burkii]